MDYPSLAAFLEQGKDVLAKGPVALILVEDLVEVESTIRHHLNAGFCAVVLFAPTALQLPADLSAAVHRIPYAMHAPDALINAVNPVIAACPPTTWLYYCYNAEYLFFPFCETRSVGELLAFHAEERRSAMLCYAIDLYAPDLGRCPNAVSLDEAMLDRSGYYALVRPDAEGKPRERQYDFYGGLRWRFEEHVQTNRRKIDRIALFRPQPGLKLQANHTFNIEEYNTFACPWHHNLTAAIVSFRVAKALKFNPGSTFDIHNFRWHNSVPFEWHSQQLMDLGLMEPGQWF
ncbi:hypothetical protein [Paenirhodobacter sp. CAU 1674]|uniref:hypothetical protein n=1 Tax=Paenirhodobacter sp. CAU 1674 TaxID=3032596 RepID=UPI0023DC5263|nr:hypothetical protein [Paenirhodobacter sp. CAU 1674]MDF2142234.1 hypothetical protein [Paenirhodobacter sp. CAU 1674]